MNTWIRKLTLLYAAAALLCAPALLVAAETEADSTHAQAPIDQCVACHTESDYLPDGYNADDIHMKPGLSCSGCHGGDPTSDDPDVAMSEEKGFVGVPDRGDMSAFCGKCHSNIEFMRKYQPRIPTDQAEQYATSVHGQRLAKGDRKVAVCVSCHTAHSILSVHDTRSTVHPFNVPATCNHCHGNAEYMAEYGIPTDQYAQYVKSVHGEALLEDQDEGAPACNDCHGNHGATPPGVAAIDQVCGHCHVNNATYFSGSIMSKAFAARQMHGCEECHGNHGVKKTSDALVGTHKGAFCIECHKEGDPGYVAAGKINHELVGLVNAYDAAVKDQKHVHKIGMNDEEIGFLLQEAHQSLIQARTLVHTFDPDEVRKKTDEGGAKVEQAVELASAEVKDYKVRRRGFGMATLFTTILAIALFLTIRKMEVK